MTNSLMKRSNGWYEVQRLPPSKTRQDLDLEVLDLRNYTSDLDRALAAGFLIER